MPQVILLFALDELTPMYIDCTLQFHVKTFCIQIKTFVLFLHTLFIYVILAIFNHFVGLELLRGLFQSYELHHKNFRLEL